MLLRNNASISTHALEYIFYYAKYLCSSQQFVTEVSCICQVARKTTFSGAFRNSAIRVVMSVHLQADNTKLGTINFQPMFHKCLWKLLNRYTTNIL